MKEGRMVQVGDSRLAARQCVKACLTGLRHTIVEAAPPGPEAQPPELIPRCRKGIAFPHWRAAKPLIAPWSSMSGCMLFQFLQTITKLVARNTQHLCRLSLIAAAAFDCLPHQRHLHLVQGNAARRQMK